MKIDSIVEKYIGEAKKGKKNKDSQKMYCNKCKKSFRLSDYDPESQHNACPKCNSLDIDEK